MNGSRFCAVALVAGTIACGSSTPTTPTTSSNTGAFTTLTLTGAGTIDQIGQTASIVATASRANGTSQIVTSLASWSSANPTAISVSAAGVASGLDVGTTTITATYQGLSATQILRVGAQLVCSSYVPTTLSVMPSENLFIITAPLGGSTEWMDAYDTSADASIALAVFQRYRNFCDVGRGNVRTDHFRYVVSYWLNQFGLSTTIANEDCETYDPRTLQVAASGAAGWSVNASGRQMVLLDSAADATTIAWMMKNYSNQCYIGRNSETSLHRYWK